MLADVWMNRQTDRDTQRWCELNSIPFHLEENITGT